MIQDNRASEITVGVRPGPAATARDLWQESGDNRGTMAASGGDPLGIRLPNPSDSYVSRGGSPKRLCELRKGLSPRARWIYECEFDVVKYIWSYITVAERERVVQL